MQLFASARFCDTVVTGRQLQAVNPRGLAEIAFLGRSNAGKSTCINLVCGQKRLAFASRTPGRTQALNLFALGPPNGDCAYLVDTPGYGFAAAPPGAKESWQALAGDYLRNRACLRAAVMIVDIRRGLGKLDRDLLSWAPDHLALLVVLTKSDKVGRMQVAETRRSVAADPAITARSSATEVVPFSALARTGVDEVRSWIANSLCRGSVERSAPSLDGSQPTAQAVAKP